MITLEERVAEFREVVRSCQLCPLSQTRTLAVPGEGPVTADVMCIGEAPGMNEDKQGMPFVGAAGNFLTELLGAAGLTRDDVYICNVLKCRPPANRDPLPDEIEACSDYLDLQIDMVDPLVIVTLGRFSMSKWFPQQAISRIHGSVKEVDGRFIVPMYHPAAALHQGSLRQVLLDDFAKLPAIVQRARARRNAAALTPSTSPDSAPLRGRGEDVVVEADDSGPGGAFTPSLSPDSPALRGRGEDVVVGADDSGPGGGAALTPLPSPDSAALRGRGEGVVLEAGDGGAVGSAALTPRPSPDSASVHGRGEDDLRATDHSGAADDMERTAEGAPAVKSSQLSFFD